MCGVHREGDTCSVEAATFVWFCGEAYSHKLKLKLLVFIIVILLHYLFFISLILYSVIIVYHKNYP